MDVLLKLDETTSTPMMARVRSVGARGRGVRDEVTIYRGADPETLAFALAAAVETRRHPGAAEAHSVGVFADQGAVGGAAWRDEASGELVMRDLLIPVELLRDTATQILDECGTLLRRLLAGLSMAEWPEGHERAVSFPLEMEALAQREVSLDALREADAFAYGGE